MTKTTTPNSMTTSTTTTTTTTTATTTSTSTMITVPSLSLLQGLHQRPTASSKVLLEARQLYLSAKRISRWISTIVLRERRRTAAHGSGADSDSTVAYEEGLPQSPKRKKRRIDVAATRLQETSSNQQPQWQHWILGALGSPALSVRQMATLILLSQKEQQQWLRNALVDYLQCQAPGPADVQCMGLLVELSSASIIPHIQGWNWAIQALLSLATSCTRTTNKAIRTRLWLLIQYAHVQSKGSCGDLYRSYLWQHSGNTQKLTPLASLIGAQVLLAADLPEVARTRLAELVNPRPLVAVASAELPPATSHSPTTIREEGEEEVAMEEVDMDTVEEGEEHDEDDDDDDEHDDDDHDDGGHDTDLQDDDEEEAVVEEVEEHDDDEDESHDEEHDEEEGVEVEEEHHDDHDDEHDEEEGQDQEMTETEQEIVDVVRHFEERLLDINDNHVHDSRPSSSSGVAATIVAATAATAPTSVVVDASRKKAYIQAALQVLLHAQYPPVLAAGASAAVVAISGMPIHHQQNKGAITAPLKVIGNHPAQLNHQQQQSRPLLTTTAEQLLLQSVQHVIFPPKKPLNLKIFMRRAPSQEEFFRGSLQRNPISFSNISSQTPNAEVTVRDLRDYIAEQLQMSETAELIELLCANKILNLDLKLRVVHQSLWKQHLLENSTSVFSSSLLAAAGGSGQPTFFSTGSGLSMVFSADGGAASRGGDRRGAVSADTPASALPPMVVTYRLAGVDGEATEDMVDTLVDPEAVTTTSPEEQELLAEKEFGLTRLVTEGRGITVLLRSIQNNVRDTLRRIRRDDVVFKSNNKNSSTRGQRREKNLSLASFENSAPCAGLTLLKHCTKLPSNRKKLVDARSPTILLRLLLDVLNAIDDSSSSSSTDAESSSTDQNAQVVSNPTAVMLEHLIETLASDISTDDDSKDEMDDDNQGSSTLPLLLSSLKTIYLGPQLRKVIAKLLPFLTYGQSSLARELAENFDSHIKVDKLSDCEAKEQPKIRRFVLMDTFVQAAICLPPNDVCNSLRSELMKCGFVEKLILFILQDMPDQPPPWSSALWPKASKKQVVSDLEQSWKYYFLRSGIKTAFDMLVGLCGRHNDLQALVANYNDQRFIHSCHWIESTSDSKTVRIYLNGLGLLAETLLDELKEGNAEVAKMVGVIRRKTRERKKEISDERRSKALVSMSSFGPIAGAAEERPFRTAESGMGDAIRSSASSFLAPVLDFFNTAGGSDTPGTSGVAKGTPTEQPAWMAEMEALEDEPGLTCAVCQEGRTLQPSELLGLYCYVKKVSIPHNKCGGSRYIDGGMLLMALPSSLPTSLVGDTLVEHHWYSLAKSTGDYLRSSNQASASASRRLTQLTTTVSAGNAIHCSCHSKARSADRNHPKAPKSEWEGASLRNSRVNCNVILPLVSSKSSKVPLVAVDMGLTDYQTAIANLLGARPKAMLWTVLNDVRLLLLRMTYGEALNADCDGGSLSSNVSLLFYQLLLADMFTNDAEHDSPQTARHARCLSGGFLAASKILQADDYDSGGKSAALTRALADAAPMAALTCIVYHNTKDEENPEPEKDAMVPHPKRRWELNKEAFLCGLIVSAGRRHVIGVEDSGCQNSRKGRHRQSSFSDWEVVEETSAESEIQEPATKKRKGSASSVMSKRGLVKIDDFAIALRPMITLYAIFDAMSSIYVPCMTDEMIEDSSAVLVKQLEGCQKAKGIHDLLKKAGVMLDNDRIIEELQKGMVSA